MTRGRTIAINAAEARVRASPEEFATKESTLDPAEVLRDRERVLALEYGASHPPHALSGEDLECEDPRDARHWVRVYSELVDFVHSLAQNESPEPVDGEAQDAGSLPPDVRAMTLQVRVLELHLAYWTERLRRLGRGCDPSRGEINGEQKS